MVGGIEGSIYGIAGVRMNMPDADPRHSLEGGNDVSGVGMA